MLERSPYPLLTLKLLGSICPCLEKEDDGTARRAAWSLSSVHVRWHKGANNLSENNNNASTMMSGFVKGIFGGSSSTDGGISGGSSDKSYESIDGCTLTIEDAKGGVQLIMSPPPSRAIGKKRVPLRMIKTVRLAAPSRSSSNSSSGIEVILDNNDVVLRFDVLKPLQFSEEDIDEENIQVEDADDATRDDTLVQLQILVEWERRRQAHLITLGVDEPAEDIDQINDNDGQSSSSPKRGGGMIADKARKVQHFAQREIEMQKQKRDRESRKAKYVKEAGGLKYTAIAMANRS
jgi:hypothetical protein